jgi:hypothetical protein
LPGPTGSISRGSIYADFQGWEPQLTDLDRFVSFSRHRCGFQENQQVYMTGLRLTGLMFGKGDLAVRIYDKTVEIHRRGVSWLPDLLGHCRQCPASVEAGVPVQACGPGRIQPVQRW